MSKSISSIQFTANDKSGFYATLRKRVDEYFHEKGLKKSGNASLYFKTICMWTFYLTPYFLILLGGFNAWIMLGLAIVMGVAVTGIGFSIQHDANHKAYSEKPFLNKFLGFNMNLIGGNSFIWKIQHNVLHHTYTNIKGADEDLEAPFVLRLSPYSKWRPMHRYQHLYAIFFYGMLTMMWVMYDDFRQLFKYWRTPINRVRKSNLLKEFAVMILSKMIFIGYTVVVPLMVLDILWWQYLIGIVAMQYTAGVILSTIFQMAHIVESTIQILPDSNGTVADSWAAHQLKTTANFCRRNPVLSWFIGGLNYQIEHHLFTNISHVHYKSLSPIVEKVASEFNLPYLYFPTFRDALKSHFKTLKALGQNRLQTV